ncbi:conserved hypothetical protein [Ixodes scapularis]|uniref:E3 UFM1-protein ligase 1 homolog n=1 Tax=Ixodes scapularis TaxID=6945 RepID=B7PNZ2_IXOSC|nr:conserved hypothetical protein [Ixodes scapularis]|eukprot:XP_002435484.1 conserved hypothetical protein [Ixodes scapularis]
MATDWEEVKRLAADFQRAQLSTTVQRLSERNCIEIVKKLIELKLIDVIFTNDGKEYITPKHLQKEIMDELTVAGGRINLVDLAHNLNVDLSHIEARCSELLRSEHSLQVVLGQLIDRSYLDTLAEDINEKLQQAGHITFGEITKQYDLPPDFLEDVIHSRLGSTIKGHADPHDRRHIFTDAYVAQHKYRVRGALSAVTRPVSLSSLVNMFQFPEKLLYGMIEDLVKEGRLAGSLVGGRSERASYIPDLYSRSQGSWVDTCYHQNGYLEYDALTRLGIQDPKGYVKRRFKDDGLVFLKNLCLGQTLLAQVEAAVDEVAATGAWVDLAPLLPSVFSAEEVSSVIQAALKSRPKGSAAVQQLLDTMVVSEAFVETCMRSFDPLMTAKAELAVSAGPGASHRQSTPPVAMPTATDDKQEKKDERRKKATGGKSGGGTQGRETKTKAVKSKKRTGGKGGRGNDSDSEEDRPGADADRGGSSSARSHKGGAELEFMTVQEMQAQLEQLKILEDCPKELSLSIAQKIHRPLTRQYQEVARSVFLTSSSASGAARRKTHAELQDKLASLLTSIQLFDKGLKLLPANKKQDSCLKNGLKVCAHDPIIVFNALENFVSEGDSCELAKLHCKAKNHLVFFSASRRVRINEHRSCELGTTEDFLADVDVVLGAGVCDMIIRSDKKKERQALHGHRQALLAQLAEAREAALCLHLAVLLVAQAQTQRMVHASGKFVPQLVAFLRTQLPPEVFATLHEAQELVMKHLTLDDTSEEKSEVASKLEELIPRLKELGATYKRQGTTEE